MKTKKQVILTQEEYLSINNAIDVLCDMVRNINISTIINSQLPCGFGVEDIRDGLQYLTDIVEVE